jgi:hypothetical protein
MLAVKVKNGTYMWTDGHLYQYSNFADKEPAILEDDVQCVMIYEKVISLCSTITID